MASSLTVIELKSLGVGTIIDAVVAVGAGVTVVTEGDTGAKGTGFGYCKAGAFCSSIRTCYS